MSTTNILDLNNRIDALEKIAHNVEPIQQQIDELKAWTDPGTKDASGNPITLTDGSERNAEGLVVTLEPKQSGSGTPSPDNVRPITGYTECVVTVKDEDETTQDTVTIAFGQTVYGGSVDFKTGKVTVTHAIADMGDYEWVYVSDSDVVKGFYAFESSINTTKDNPLICSQYKTATGMAWIGIGNNEIGTNAGAYKTQLIVKDSRYTDAATFTTAVTGQTICYELATPIELTLTPAELELLKGYNYISTNGTTIELTYMPDTLKADILLTVSQLYGSKISIFDGILTGGTTGQVLTKVSDDNYDATWSTLPATRTTTKKSEK